MSTKIQVNILKNDRVLVFWSSETTIFSRHSRQFLYFPDFKNLSDLGRSKSILGSIIAFAADLWPVTSDRVRQAAADGGDAEAGGVHGHLWGAAGRTLPETGVRPQPQLAVSLPAGQHQTAPGNTLWTLDNRQLQVIPDNSRRLQGIALDVRQVQGIALDVRQRQGIALDVRHLQGIAPDIRHLQGIAPDVRQLQGIALDSSLKTMRCCHWSICTADKPGKICIHREHKIPDK